MRLFDVRVLALGVVPLALVGTLPAQSSPSICGAPPIVSATSQPNIFTPQQELWLGDAMADMVEAEFRPARDASQNAHLQAIVDRLAATLPQNTIPFHIQLIDSSEVNGMSLAGGHIYLTRKLVAAAQNDDELAGVIAHEMGHIVSHQFTFETTRDLKRLLGVTSVSDRADIYKKFQSLTDARLTDKHPGPSGDDDDKQNEADKIGAYIAAAAGYRPGASAELWDRVFFVGGKTGSRLGDFFGITKPDQKRLRALQSLVAALPPGCGGTFHADESEFARWHRAVVANQQAASAPSTTSGAAVPLTPALHMDLDRLRFSRDGKMILAQDESSIFVLTRAPLKLLFRIDAHDALPAEFSPDSTRIVFNTPGMHTEEWSIADRKLISAHEVFFNGECVQTEISPDGRTLICLSFHADSSDLDLSLIDVATDDVAWQKKYFFTPSLAFLYSLYRGYGANVSQSFMPSSISADGNTLLIGPDLSKLAIDLRSRTPVKMSGKLKDDIGGAYAFLGNDKVVGVDLTNFHNSGVFSFPDGKQLQKFPLGVSDISSVSNPGQDPIALTHDVKGAAVGVLFMSTQREIGLKSAAVDIWTGSMVAETSGGLVGISQVDGNGALVAQSDPLPISPLASLRASSISPDGRFMALSTRHHGGVWNIATGKQVLRCPGFTASQWTSSNLLYLDIPKFGDSPRRLVSFDPATGKTANVPYPLDDNTRLRYGYFLEWKQGNGKSFKLTAHNTPDNASLWSRTFADGYPIYTGSAGTAHGDLIFSYPLKTANAKEILAATPAISRQVSAMKVKDNGRVVEVVDATTGKTEATVALELPANYGGVDAMNRAGNLIYMGGKGNRTNVYDLQDGKLLRQLFGYLIAIDPVTLRAALINRGDEIFVFEPDGTQVARYQMGSDLRVVQFRNQGKALTVLTADQNLHLLDLTKTSAPAAASSSSH